MPKHLTSPGAKRSSCIPDWSNFTSAEAERAVYMAGRYSDAKQLRRIVMVTSCVHDITNASTAWGIATAAAADGRPTAFVNLDFNRHNVPYLKRMERSPEPIERYLRNQAVIGEIVQSIPTLPGFGFIDAAHVMTEPFRSLDSEKLCELIMDLKQSGYDFIVLHAPPVLTSGDATWLAPFVDGVMVIANWGKTTEEQLLEAATQLRMNHAHLIGTVINQVNPEMHRRHHYGGFVITSKRIPAGRWQRGRGNAFPERPDADVNTLQAPAVRPSITRPSNVA